MATKRAVLKLEIQISYPSEWTQEQLNEYANSISKTIEGVANNNDLVLRNEINDFKLCR